MDHTLIQERRKHLWEFLSSNEHHTRHLHNRAYRESLWLRNWEPVALIEGKVAKCTHDTCDRAKNGSVFITGNEWECRNVFTDLNDMVLCGVGETELVVPHHLA